MQYKRVVITGLGLVTSLGNDVTTSWHNLTQGKSGADKITHFDTSKFKTQFACEVKDLDMSHLLDPKEIRRYDRYIHYAIKSAEEAIQDAQINVNQEDALRCGVIYGSGMGGINTLDNNIGGFGAGDGTPRYSPFFIPMIITMCVAFFWVHSGATFATKELSFIYLTIFTLLYITGPGEFSFDSLIGKYLIDKNDAAA